MPRFFGSAGATLWETISGANPITADVPVGNARSVTFGNNGTAASASARHFYALPSAQGSGIGINVPSGERLYINAGGFASGVYWASFGVVSGIGAGTGWWCIGQYNGARGYVASLNDNGLALSGGVGPISFQSNSSPLANLAATEFRLYQPIRFHSSAGTPSNTATPDSWIPVQKADGTTGYLPLYK